MRTFEDSHKIIDTYCTHMMICIVDDVHEITVFFRHTLKCVTAFGTDGESTVELMSIFADYLTGAAEWPTCWDVVTPPHLLK